MKFLYPSSSFEEETLIGFPKLLPKALEGVVEENSEADWKDAERVAK